jgi:hypothetical protein
MTWRIGTDASLKRRLRSQIFPWATRHHRQLRPLADAERRHASHAPGTLRLFKMSARGHFLKVKLVF